MARCIHRHRDEVQLLMGIGMVPVPSGSHCGLFLSVDNNEALLSTGAWGDFSQHITALVLCGRLDDCGGQCLR